MKSKKNRFSSLTNLTDLQSSKKTSGGRRRRNSISLDDIQNLKRFTSQHLVQLGWLRFNQVVSWKRGRTIRKHLPCLNVWIQQKVLPIHRHQSKGEDRVSVVPSIFYNARFNLKISKMEESKSFCLGTQTILLWGTQALLAGSAGKPNPGIKKNVMLRYQLLVQEKRSKIWRGRWWWGGHAKPWVHLRHQWGHYQHQQSR